MGELEDSLTLKMEVLGQCPVPWLSPNLCQKWLERHFTCLPVELFTWSNQVRALRLYRHFFDNACQNLPGPTNVDTTVEPNQICTTIKQLQQELLKWLYWMQGPIHAPDFTGAIFPNANCHLIAVVLGRFASTHQHDKEATSSGPGFKEHWRQAIRRNLHS